MPPTRASVLERGSERYREAFARLERALRDVYPDATEAIEYGSPGWRVARPPQAFRPPVKGTISLDHLQVSLVERKSGLTLHFWYPGDYYLFERRGKALAEAGLKVMRGCLVWNRKGDFPVEPIRGLLLHVRDLDERGVAAALPEKPRPRGAKPTARAKGTKAPPRETRPRAASAKGARVSDPARPRAKKTSRRRR